MFIDVATSSTFPRTVLVRCVTAPIKEATIVWEYRPQGVPTTNLGSGEEESFEGGKHVFQWNSTRSGVYTCNLISDDSIVASSSRLIVERGQCDHNVWRVPSSSTYFIALPDLKLDLDSVAFPHSSPKRHFLVPHWRSLPPTKNIWYLVRMQSNRVTSFQHRLAQRWAAIASKSLQQHHWPNCNWQRMISVMADCSACTSVSQWAAQGCSLL